MVSMRNYIKMLKAFGICVDTSDADGSMACPCFNFFPATDFKRVSRSSMAAIGQNVRAKPQGQIALELRSKDGTVSEPVRHNFKTTLLRSRL